MAGLVCRRRGICSEFGRGGFTAFQGDDLPASKVMVHGSLLAKRARKILVAMD
jgi:hypothetical protein